MKSLKKIIYEFVSKQSNYDKSMKSVKEKLIYEFVSKKKQNTTPSVVVLATIPSIVE